MHCLITIDHKLYLEVKIALKYKASELLETRVSIIQIHVVLSALKTKLTSFLHRILVHFHMLFC